MPAACAGSLHAAMAGQAAGASGREQGTEGEYVAPTPRLPPAPRSPPDSQRMGRQTGSQQPSGTSSKAPASGGLHEGSGGSADATEPLGHISSQPSIGEGLTRRALTSPTAQQHHHPRVARLATQPVVGQGTTRSHPSSSTPANVRSQVLEVRLDCAYETMWLHHCDLRCAV
jgi:hypothetical protein